MGYFATLLAPAFRNHMGNRMPNTGGWQDRHLQAVTMPKGPELGIVSLITGWAMYADTHRARYENGIGKDYFLGPCWAAIGANIRTLLNGECGRLDCGTLDAFLHDTLKAEGFDPDNL
jgi:hypothetical protein